MQSATCVLLSRSTLDSKSEKSSRPRLKSKPVLAMAAGIKRKVDSVGWDACTATGSGKAGMCTHRVAHRCAPRCERLGIPDVKSPGGVEVVRFRHLQPTLPPFLGRNPASFSDMRPHDGKSPTGMRERQPAKPAKKKGGGHTLVWLTTGRAPSKPRSGLPRLPLFGCAVCSSARARRSSGVPNASTPAACNIKANCHNRQAETGGSG